MADISSIKSSERTIEILHPGTKELLGVSVSLLAMDDPALKPIKRKILDRRLHLDARGKSFKAEEIDENRTDLVFRAMTGWKWYDPKGGDDTATFRGEVPEFTRRNVIAVFEELPWFRDQIDDALSDEQAFFNNSKPN